MRIGRDFIDAIVSALTAPARRERAIVVVLAAYAALWTLYGMLSKAIQDLQLDVAELAVWSRHLALGYAKHPPLAAWLMHGWFAVFPEDDWACYLLAMVYAALGLWIAWRLFQGYLEPHKRIVALASLMLVPYFNFLGLRFDHNAVLGALWAATAYCFIRSFDTRSPGWAAAAGAAAAAAMLGKYWSIFLLAGLGLAAMTDRRRAAYFRSVAPWITIAVGALLLAPHVVWLASHDWAPLAYAVGAHGVKSLGRTLATAVTYLAGGLAYAAVPALVVAAAVRPDRAALLDTVWPSAPERRFVGVAFWATLLIPAVVGLLFEFDLNPIWTLPGLVLLPVMLLSSPLVALSRRAVTLIVAAAVVLPVVMVLAAPAIALATHLAGVNPSSVQGRALARRVDEEWRQATSRPLRIVGGDFDLANVTAFYLPQRPDALPVLEPETAPWVTPERVTREGAAMTCYLNEGQHACVREIAQAIDRFAAHNPPQRRIEVTIVRSYLGVPGTPGRYLITIVPPQP